jgi:peptide/nickel transport system permease protein
VTRYILRRMLYMIPTFIGVILITFVLFNIVGGSPAAMTLGKNASPLALEEFDEQRGFNKPLIAGWWTGTRALPETDFREGAGAWRAVTGAEWVNSVPGTGVLRIAPGSPCLLPIMFPLHTGTTYRVVFTGRMPSGGVLQWQVGDRHEKSPTVESYVASENWIRRVFPLPSEANGKVGALRLAVTGGPLELRTITLERRMPHAYDSQLVHYFRQLARLDLGESVATNQKVGAMLRRGILPSLMLTVPVFFGGLVISVSLALVCAYLRNRWPDRLLVLGAVALMSVNYLVWIIFGQFFLAYRLRWFPIWGFESWTYLLLPVVIGIISGLGGDLRFYRTIMLDEFNKDYVRTAFAKGLGPVGVLFKHVLPNAMIPIVTNTVVALPFLYTGSLLLESFFGIPGLGGLSVNAINSADVDVVRGVVLVGAILYMAASLVSDLCYALVDPRVKLR